MKIATRKNRLSYLIYKSEGKERKFFLFQVVSLLLFLVFLSFFSLSNRNPFKILIPGLNFSYPLQDKRAIVEIFFPDEKTSEYIPSPKKILIVLPRLNASASAKQIIENLFYSMSQGPRRKKPGEKFHPSDDKILRHFPEIGIRQVWLYKKDIYVDLYLTTLVKPKKQIIADLFHCFRLTIEKSKALRKALQTKNIYFRIDGDKPSHRAEKQKEYKELLALVPEKIVL